MGEEKSATLILSGISRPDLGEKREQICREEEERHSERLEVTSALLRSSFLSDRDIIGFTLGIRGFWVMGGCLSLCCSSGAINEVWYGPDCIFWSSNLTTGCKFAVGEALLLYESMEGRIVKNPTLPLDLIREILLRLPRKLSEIPLIDHLTAQKYEIYCLRAMGRFLNVSCSVQGCAEDEIWVMKEYKVQSSWTKFITIPKYEIRCNRFSPICVTKDGRILGSNIAGRLEELDDKGNVLEVFIYGGYERLFCINLQSAIYRESLLSIPNVIRETCEDDQS
ncbi:hypothetical protein Fmac_017361 [Flemingia macrophylla]|uniref:F-box protein n=1 Tax=Flemingia macrophylla TaxID=520843 RepID=A0ABD1M3S2_9FABA